MTFTVSTFQLGSSTVVTLPKKLGIKPGTKMEVKKTKNGATFKLDRRQSLLDALDKARGIWTEQDFKDYQKRRKLGIEAAKRMREGW